VNEEKKSGIRQPHQVHFLGFRFQCRQTAEGWQTAVLLSAKAERRLRTTVRDGINSFSVEVVAKRLRMASFMQGEPEIIPVDGLSAARRFTLRSDLLLDGTPFRSGKHSR
jgi:hypothetical protein